MSGLVKYNSVHFPSDLSLLASLSLDGKYYSEPYVYSVQEDAYYESSVYNDEEGNAHYSKPCFKDEKLIKIRGNNLDISSRERIVEYLTKIISYLEEIPPLTLTSQYPRIVVLEAIRNIEMIQAHYATVNHKFIHETTKTYLVCLKLLTDALKHFINESSDHKFTASWFVLNKNCYYSQTFD